MLRSQARSLPVLPSRPPAPQIDPRSASYVDEALGPGGHLSKVRAGYEVRSGQLAMARAIDAAIRDKRHLFVEAPTGTGKGNAYLVPAIHHAIERRQKVIVVTANINLQEQLVKKDLPALRAALPTPFTFGLAKGRANYLCLEAFEENDPQRDPRWRDVQQWALVTKTGDVSELPFEAGPMKKLFTVGAEECLGRVCPSFDKCHAEAAKRAAAQADVVVTNYHLFLLDMLIKLSDPERGPLPVWTVAILDEAHNAADIARDLLGYRVTRGMVDAIARLLSPKRDDKIDENLAMDLSGAAADYFEGLLVHARSPEYKARIRKPGEFGGDHLAGMLRYASSALEEASEEADAKKRAKLKKGAERAAVLASQVNRASELTDSERKVYCIEVEGDRDRERAALVCKLIWPADVLRPKLFDIPGRVVAMTSATLAVDGSFDFVAHELGAESARELTVPTPFDFEKQALLVVPRGMPDPRKRAEHEAYVAETLIEIAGLAEGRTLALFTSNRGLRTAAIALRRASSSPICTWGSVLVQGEAPRGQLVESFRREVGSVLLGTDSFWEGVDVPGEALSVVVIDRLPFASPDDPVLDAVDLLLPKGAFDEWSLPRAVTAMRQGVGRLIRSRTDRGVAVILDDRILTKGYGRKFLRSLPAMPLSRDLEDVGSFLAGNICT